MKATRQFTAVIQQEDKLFVALCPELDVASRGKTVEQARKNLIEAVGLLLECASPSELKRRLLDYLEDLEDRLEIGKRKHGARFVSWKTTIRRVGSSN